MDRESLSLRQILEEDYCKIRDWVKRERGYFPPAAEDGAGYSLIGNPMVFDTDYMLRVFMADRAARHVSVRLGHKRWVKFEKRRMDEIALEHVVRLAEERRHIFLAFLTLDASYNKFTDHEIFFYKSDGRMVSYHVTMPGSQKRFYGWNGSNEKFTKVHGVYVPMGVVREMGVRLG